MTTSRTMSGFPDIAAVAAVMLWFAVAALLLTFVGVVKLFVEYCWTVKTFVFIFKFFSFSLVSSRTHGICIFYHTKKLHDTITTFSASRLPLSLSCLLVHSHIHAKNYWCFLFPIHKRRRHHSVFESKEIFLLFFWCDSKVVQKRKN